MRLDRALLAAHQVHWDKTSHFEVFWAPNYKMTHNMDVNNQLNNNIPKDVATYSTRANETGGVISWHPTDNERLSIHIVSFTLPNFSSQTLSSFTGGRWTHHMGQLEEHNFSFTVRDANQGEFYRLFMAYFREQQFRYYDDFTFNFFISLDSDYMDGYHKTEYNGAGIHDKYAKPLISLKRCMITGVSGLAFSNDEENNIQTFEVSCVANDVEIYDAGARSFYGYDGDLNYHDKILGEVLDQK